MSEARRRWRSSACDRDDQLVAGVVPERVVDGLELVEVEDEQSAFGSVAFDVFDVAVELGFELAAVQEAGERVVVGHELQLGLEPFAVGDVEELAEQPAGASASRCASRVAWTETSTAAPAAGMIRRSSASCSMLRRRERSDALDPVWISPGCRSSRSCMPVSSARV